MKRVLVSVFFGISLLFANPGWAIYTNGDFESAGFFEGWITGYGLNSNGLSGSPPFTEANIQISPGGVGLLAIVGAGSDSRTLGQLALPRYGQRTAKVNDENSGYHLNIIRQTDAIRESDRDTSDGRLHVRFSYAAVMQDPGHTPQDQPYFHVSLKNITRGTTLYDSFFYTSQAGVTWNVGDSNWRFTSWQDVDIVIPDVNLGDQLEISALAADCAQGAHGGYVYLDGFGSAAAAPAPPPTPEPVPTMNIWGLLMMSLLLGGTALYRMRKRKVNV